MAFTNRDIHVTVYEDVKGDGFRRAADDLDRAGNKTQRLTHDFNGLNREIDVTKQRIHEMHLRFAQTRDDSIFGDIRKEEANLRRLQRAAKELASAIVPTSALAGQKVFDFSQTGTEARYMAYAALAVIGDVLIVPLGAMIAGAIVGGVGLGGIVGGVVAAAHNQQVKDAFGDLFGKMGSDVKSDATSFIDPLVRGADILGDSWDNVSGLLQNAFTTLAPTIEPLAAGIGGAASELAQGFNAAAKAAVPIIEDLSGELPQLGDAFGDFLTMLSRPGADARGGLQDLVDLLEQIVESSGATISGLAATQADWKKVTGDRSWLQGVLFLLNPAASAGLSSLDIWTSGNEALAESAETATKAIGGELRHVDDFGRVVSDATGKVVDLGGAFDKTAYETELFNRALDKSYNHFLDLIGAEISTEAAIDSFTESVREHGRTLDIDTEAGRANLESLKRIAEAANDAYQQKLKETGSVFQAQQEYDKYRQKLYDTLIALHYTADEAQRLTDKWLALSLLPDITKRFTVRYTTGVPQGTFGGGFQEFASGGMVQGPFGSPQLAVVHAGERVLTPAQQMSGMGGGGTTRVVVDMTGGDDELMRWLRRRIRISGGTGSDSVQVALGQN